MRSLTEITIPETAFYGYYGSPMVNINFHSERMSLGALQNMDNPSLETIEAAGVSSYPDKMIQVTAVVSVKRLGDSLSKR